jgi:hypothetical protein
VQRWLVKIDDESGGRGTAHADVARIPGLAADLADLSTTLQSLLEDLNVPGVAWGRWPVLDTLDAYQLAPVDELRCQAEASAARRLLGALPKALVVAAPAAYPSYRAFVQARTALHCSRYLTCTNVAVLCNRSISIGYCYYRR